MVYVVGDTHGDQNKWSSQIEPFLKLGDTVIVAGDFGVGFWGDRERSEEAFFDHIGRQAYNVLFVDGNHENFNKLNRYPVDLWNEGWVHKLRGNLIHLMRGEVYVIDGLKVFAFGGGYSRDRYMRHENVSWWPQEVPSEEDYAHGDAGLQRMDHQVDCIITHSAPSESLYYLQRYGIRAAEEEYRLNCYLDTVQDRVRYKHWYFGHWHIDMDLWRNQTAVFNTLRELESGKVVRTIK